MGALSLLPNHSAFYVLQRHTRHKSWLFMVLCYLAAEIYSCLINRKMIPLRNCTSCSLSRFMWLWKVICSHEVAAPHCCAEINCIAVPTTVRNARTVDSSIKGSQCPTLQILESTCLIAISLAQGRGSDWGHVWLSQLESHYWHLKDEDQGCCWELTMHRTIH